MKTTSYPALGQSVSFIRQNLNDKENPISQGVGTIVALSLDVHKRQVVTILTTKATGEPDKVNVDINALNPSEEFVAKFKSTLEAVAAFQSEGNGKAQEIVAEYNQRIQEAYSAVLGAPIEIDQAA